jgi:Glycosyltransferase 61
MAGSGARGTRLWQALRRLSRLLLLLLRRRGRRGGVVAAGLLLFCATLAVLALVSSRGRSTPRGQPVPVRVPVQATAADARRIAAARAALARLHDVMPSPSPWPQLQGDTQRLEDRRYGTSGEKCFAIGVNDEAASLWQLNSRALCFDPNPVCLYGSRLDDLVSFKERGSGECNLLYTNTHFIKRASAEQLEGSCARFRTHRVYSMFAGNKESYSHDFDQWHRNVTVQFRSAGRRRPPIIEWQRDFAIVVPKYDWSVNICHYNRIWQYLMYVVRHLHLFVPDRSHITQVHLLFRAKADYDNPWAVGLRQITIPAVEHETGYKIVVSKIRHDHQVDLKCFKRAIFLGREGRVDAYPFFNDTAVWSKDFQINDDHVPDIPHDSLWFRGVAYRAFGLSEVAELADGFFTSIPVPPRRVAWLQRSRSSRRRFSSQSEAWFDATLERLARQHGLDLRRVHFERGSSLGVQASLVRDVGLAVGIHGANLVNTIFMPPAAALFEVFPFRYVRYYYASGANSGLRYSFHETSTGIDHHCDASVNCFFMYRESEIHLNDDDRQAVERRMDTAMRYLVRLHIAFPSGRIPLERRGNTYVMPRSS